jgi:hypothetical protein
VAEIDDAQLLREVADRIAIVDVIGAVTLRSDLNEADRILELYTDDAVIDYSALSGAGSSNIPVEVHRQRLATFLPGFDKRQHQTSNFEVTIDGEEAHVRSQVRAIHTIGSEVWRVHGTYHHRLVRTLAGWKINYQRADIVHQEGEQLIALARARLAGTQTEG